MKFVLCFFAGRVRSNAILKSSLSSSALPAKSSTPASLSLQSLNTIDEKYISLLKLNESQVNKLYLLRDEIIEHNKNVNLISRGDIENIIPKHILPSLSIQMLEIFTNSNNLQNKRVIDVGTGGGFPELPLAIINQNVKFTLLDSQQKKINIINEIIKKLNLTNVEAVCCRSEDLKPKINSLHYDFVLGRAVCSFYEFIKSTKHLIKSTHPNQPNTRGIIYIKGGDVKNEIEECKFNLQRVPIYKVNELLTDLDSDKNLVYFDTLMIKSIK